MLPSYLCGYYLAQNKCELVPSRALRYLGIICGSERVVFQVPLDKLGKLLAMIPSMVLEEKRLSAPTLETTTCIVGNS